MFDKIADIFNLMAETGELPQYMETGILIPLQKLGKKKGKVENVRPVILLNIIRKTLAIVLLNRTIQKLDNSIPLSQAAYRSGRNTTELQLTELHL